MEGDEERERGERRKVVLAAEAVRCGASKEGGGD